MKKNLKVSVVTPVLNCSKYIEQCIQSVIDQSYENFEHIIIDGGSNDGTLEIIKKYPHIDYISECDEGEGFALNKGIKLTTGDIILWLNADDWLEVDVFRPVSELFREKNAKCVYGNTKFYDNDDRHFWNKNSSPKIDTEYLTRWFYAGMHPHQPSMYFHREIFDEIGLFNQKLCYSIDLDFWLRVSNKYNYTYLNRTLSHARIRSDSKSWDTEKDQIKSHWKICLPYVKKSNNKLQYWIDYFESRILQRKTPELTKIIDTIEYAEALSFILNKADQPENIIRYLYVNKNKLQK